MARFETSVPSDRTLQETFVYMADFRNVAEWDPSITSAVLTAGSPGEVGSTYDVTFSVAGHETTLPYETVEVTDNRIVMRSDTDAMTSVDTIRVRNGGQVRVEYTAEIELKGARKLADPIADLALTRAGKKAAEGLTERLAG